MPKAYENKGICEIYTEDDRKAIRRKYSTKMKLKTCAT